MSFADRIREALRGLPDPPIEFDVIESPYVPKDRIYLVPRDLGFAYPRLHELRFHEPIDWPRRAFLHDEHPLADVVATEQRKAFDFLEHLLDDFASSLTLDGVPLEPEAVWRAPRRREDLKRTLQIRLAMETRLALSIHRPIDFRAFTV